MRHQRSPRKYIRSSKRLRSKRRRLIGTPFPVTFERLEDRLVLANIFWNADADGFWDEVANWKDEFNVSRLPAVGDDVFLDRPTGAFTVTHGSSGSSIVRSLHADRSGFTLSGGSLTITAASEFRGAFALNGGNLDLDGPLTTAGTTTWTVGLVDGGTAGLTNTGTLTVTDSGLKRLSGNLVNAGTINHSSTASDLVNSSLGTVTNLAGGVYDFQGDKNITIETFINRGTLRKSAGAGTAFMSPRNFSNEGGTIDVRSGTLQISGPLNLMVGGLSTGGVFTVANGAVLDLTGPERTVRYGGTYTGSGAGIVRVRAGVLEVGATGATFNFPPGLFQWTGGIIAGGTTGISNTGSMALSGSDAKSLSGLLNNIGTVTQTGTGDLLLGSFGAFFTGPDGTFNNLAGGIYDLAGDARFANGVFNNAGTLRKSAGAGVTTLFNHRLNNIGGTIDVRSGTFLLQGTSGTPYPTHTGGNFTVAAGAFLDLTNAGGNQVFTGNFTGSGEGLVRIVGLINTGNAISIGPGGANFDFPPGLFQWTEGVINGIEGPFTNRGTMTVDVNTSAALNPFVRLRGTLNNAGTILHQGSGIMAIDGENGVGNITNLAGGVYEFQGDGAIFSRVLGASFHNYGTLRKTIGDGITGISLGNFSNTSHFNNLGTLEVAAGTLRIQSVVDQVSNDTLRGGTWKALAGGIIDLFDYPRFTTNAATVILDGPGSTFRAIEGVSRNTGSLTITRDRDLSVPIGRVAHSFDTGLINTNAIAFDNAAGNLLVYKASDSEIRELTPTGTEVPPRIPFPGGAATNVDLDVASEPLTIGGVAVPAGTLLVIHGSGARLYGIDRNTGAILASVPLSRPAGTVLGGSYHAARNTMFLVDSGTVFEINPATGALLQSFTVQPSGSPPFALNVGDLEVDPLTGNVLLVAGTYFAIRELTPTGQFVRDQSLQALGVSSLAGIAIDETTRSIWVCETLGKIYELEAFFSNGGSLTVGPGSTFDVPGTYVQDAAGTFTTQLGGSPGAGQFGRLVASRPPALDGTFGVSLVNGFGPSVGQQFTVMTFPSSNGTFSNVNSANGGRTPLFTVDHLPTSVVLRAVGSAADLAFEAFDSQFPATAVAGQPVTFSYTVRNLSDAPADGAWIDSIYLSRDGALDEGDALFGRIEHQGGVASLSTYHESLTAPLPPLPDGNYRVLVLSDSRGLVPDAHRANNVGVSTAQVAVTVPVLQLGIPVTGVIANDQDHYFRLAAPPGSDVKITADFNAATAAETYVRYRELPDRSNFDDTSNPNDLHTQLLVTNAQGGSYYVLLHGREGAGTGTLFTLEAEAAGFEIVRISPQPLRGSNQGHATVEVLGSQFTPQTVISLHNAAGESRTAQAVVFIDTNHLRVTFDLNGLPTGIFEIRAEDAGKTTTALDTFTVTGAPLGLVSLSIMSPPYVYVGGAIGVTFNVQNGNDSIAVAPILQVLASNVVGGQEDQIVFGSGLDALPGQLPPLYQTSFGVGYAPDPKGRGVVSGFQLIAINPTLTPVDWNGQKTSLRPHSIPADAWDAIWQNLRPALGETLADFYALLQRDAGALRNAGIAINSINRLFNFEMRKANDLPAVPVPAAAVDAAFPAPGLPLVFARDFGSSIADRYRLGRLGRGWVDNFDISAEIDAATDIVTIRQGGAIRLFGQKTDGSYEGLPGERARLSLVNGALQLRELGGAITAFHPDGRLNYLQDTNGNRITAEYTGNQITRLVHSNGSALTLAYNTDGRIVQVTDPAGRIATYGYDASGQHLVSVTTDAGALQYSYTTEADGPRAHAITSIGYPDGTHLFFAYDSQGRLGRQEADGGAEALTLTYDVASYRVRDSLGNLTDIFYDDTGRTVGVLDGLDRASVIEYDVANRPVKITPEGGAPSLINYDADGNPQRTLDPLGQEQEFDYEQIFGRLVNWRDALDHETEFDYDARGNPLSTTYADGSVEEYNHDAQGNLVRSVNRRGQLVRYTYDANGLVTRKDLPDGTHVEYVYDARGNLLSATDADGSTVMQYDAADRMTRIAYPSGRFLQFAYDAGGRRTRATDQSGFTVNYRYDTAGRLEELTAGGGQRLVLYQYDVAGRLASETRGNGITTSYEYDAADQLLHLIHRDVAARILSRFDYTYDDLGRRTSMTTLEGTTEYLYDEASRLILVALPGGRVIRYEYDAAGNRTQVTDNGATTSYTTNDLNQYLSVGSTSQSFDADGNLVAAAGPGGPESFSYDAEGRLVSVVTLQGTWTYEYDVFGNRVATIHNGARTEFLIDPAGLGNVVAEYDGAGNLRANYVQGLGLVSRIDATGPAAYFQFDAGGSTAQLTGPDGAVLNSYSCLPFGEHIGASETVANPFTFAGRFGVMREIHGLDYIRARWYDPMQGRFTQQDPIRLAGGTNLYTYAANSPLNLVDPSGLDPITLTGSAAARWVAGNAATEVLGPTIMEGVSLGGEPVDRATLEWFSKIDPPSAQGANSSPYVNPSTNPLKHRIGEPGGKSFAELEAAVARARFLLRLRGAARIGLYSLAAVGIAVIAAEGAYGGYYLTFGDTPECLPVVPRFLQPYCHPPVLPAGLPSGFTSTEQIDPPRDPNDIVGPGGFGPGLFVRPQNTFPYIVHFENAPDAGAPAQEVSIKQQLDADLDLDTFELGDFGFGDLIVEVPPGRQFYHTRVDLRPLTGPMRQNLLVDFTAELDRTTRTVTWTLLALDPATLDLPANLLAGFLPPDETPPEGQGFVSYTISPKPDSPTSTRIDAQASIVFAPNDPILTNIFTNTIDAAGPTSSVNPLPATTNSASFPVSWSGSDGTGSGIASFDVFVSNNGGAFVPVLEGTTATSTTFNGQVGHTYAFYSVASDNVGHQEASPDAAQATTTVLIDAIHGTPGDDDIQVIRTGDQLAVYVNVAPVGEPTYRVPLSSITMLSVLSGEGNDTLTIDCGTQPDIGLDRLVYDAGSGNNSLILANGNARIDGTAAGGTLNTTVQAGAQLSTSRLLQNSLTLQDNSEVTLLAGGDTSLLTSLTIGTGAKLDITNNALVVRATAANKDAKYTEIKNKIVSAQNGVDANFITKWDGPGITSSAARTGNVATGFDLVGLGLIRNSDLDITTGIPGSTYASFGGVPVTADDVLLKYTYIGDANLNGLVSFDDYIGMDNAFFGLIPNLGWATGDVNFDGVINFDDYSKIDKAFFFQGAPLSDKLEEGGPEFAQYAAQFDSDRGAAVESMAVPGPRNEPRMLSLLEPAYQASGQPGLTKPSARATNDPFTSTSHVSWSVPKEPAATLDDDRLAKSRRAALRELWDEAILDFVR